MKGALLRWHPAAIACMLGTATSMQAAAVSDARDTTCQVIRGTIVPACNAAICTQGVVTGDLQGRYTTKVTSIYPAGSGWIYTAWMQIELDGKGGWIETLNEGTTPVDSKGGPDLSQSTEVLSIAQASGVYQEHTGTIVIAGAHALGPVTPYVGRLCHRLP